ncbi:MAG: RNA-directed DNA polymerase [Proteobacteria bacterium]|nr:RNA-directed DNA polymerase [Pseudomonadota bacterium]
MPKKRHSYHGEKDSPFFRLRSKAKLASLLFISLEKLKALASADDLYFDFKKPKASGGFREISAPRDDLKAVQSRIAGLLQRIAPPDYLFAPVAGRSYADNAAQHLGATSVRLLDIEDFFPSCTANKAIWFFMKRMECSPDVAAVLRGVVTRNGSLPQGSPCSPILAYLCYIDMWAEVAKIVRTNGCRLSVYADDLTISGSMVPEQAIWQIKQALHKHGHRYKVSKERSKHLKPAEITGVILTRDRLLAPNRQHKKLHAVRQELRKVRSSKTRATLEAQLKGRIAQMRQIVDAKPRQ